jgi:hypothetical protein
VADVYILSLVVKEPQIFDILLPKINSVEDKLYDVKYKESEAKRIL